jgi:hypothetical protein
MIDAGAVEEAARRIPDMRFCLSDFRPGKAMAVYALVYL